MLFKCTAHIEYEIEVVATSKEDAEIAIFEALADDVTRGIINTDIFTASADCFPVPMLKSVDVEPVHMKRPADLPEDMPFESNQNADRTISEILEKMELTEQLCENCGFECQSNERCMFSDMVTHLGKFEELAEIMNADIHTAAYRANCRAASHDLCSNRTNYGIVMTCANVLRMMGQEVALQTFEEQGYVKITQVKINSSEKMPENLERRRRKRHEG